MHTDTSLHGDITIWGSCWSCRAAGATELLHRKLVLLLELGPFSVQLMLELLLLLGPFQLGYPIGHSSMKGLVIQLGVIPKPFYKCLLECHLEGLDTVGDLVPLQLPPGKV